jgi:oxaloacetate decarboxylase alpha subunit
MQCHATTGLSTATYQKAIDAGIDMLDTAISPMSMTYGHTATETIASIVHGTERDTGLDFDKMASIATYFREIRTKYAQFEGSLKGVDARILTAQVPGGMLTNMESQLKEQGAQDRFDEVLLEIPRVREDLGFIPLVTPTSQIVGTQAVINVLSGERYQSISKETAGVLKGEYGTTAAPVNKALQERVLNGEAPITCRPADLLEAELETLTDTLLAAAKEKSIILADEQLDDVLTYALFPQVGLKFLENRNNPDAFEPEPGVPGAQEPETPKEANIKADASDSTSSVYSVRVNGQVYEVEVSEGELSNITPAPSQSEFAQPEKTLASSKGALEVNAPLSGTIVKIMVKEGESIAEGDVIFILEAMKMETEVRSAHTGTIAEIAVKEGDTVQSGQLLLSVG